jgi:hypothetical protein
MSEDVFSGRTAYREGSSEKTAAALPSERLPVRNSEGLQDWKKWPKTSFEGELLPGKVPKAFWIQKLCRQKTAAELFSERLPVCDGKGLQD